MYIVFAKVAGVEHRFELVAVSKGAAVSAVRKAHPGCAIVAVL